MLIYWETNREKTLSEIKSAAVALYDMGIRPSDRNRMIYELGLSEKEADRICEIMQELKPFKATEQ